jgi:hypothetical protein
VEQERAKIIEIWRKWKREATTNKKFKNKY